jgi:beta-glucosidase
VTTLRLCVLAVTSLFLFSFSAVSQNLVSAENTRKAEALLKQMTLKEKIGQLDQSAGTPMPSLEHENLDALIEQGQVGSVLWITDTHEINRQQRIAVEKSRLHIPILFGYDVIHGYRTTFPVPIGMASSWDPSVEEQAQRYAASDARAAGILWTFGPMVDIARDGRWGRIAEGAGEDPYLGAAMARAQVRGFQGEELGPNGILACAKHFAGYGAADGGRDYDSSYIPDVLLENIYLPPFHAAEKAGVGSFMSAYMDLNDIPASGNHWLMTETLRDQWGFKGFVVSDAFAVASLKVHGYASNEKDAALKAFSAGLNMDMASMTYTHNLEKLIAEKRITEAEIDRAVLPILEIKYQLGLFEHPYADESKVEATLDRAEGKELERKLAARSMVLLKNAKQTLPLSKSIKKVAVIGPLADAAEDIEGGWTVERMLGGVSKSKPVTVLAGLRSALGSGVELDYVSGPKFSKKYFGMIDGFMGIKRTPEPTANESAEWLEKTKAASAKADIVIAVLGETADMSGENHSRATLDLPGLQQQMLEAAVASGKPVVVVLENARPLDIRWMSEHVDAILESWYPGTQGGHAVADVLTGAVNPGGKLPISWPRTVGQEPLYYNHNLTHEPEDGAKFTSRYWDELTSPLYPFGYGLSYTSFEFSNLRLDRATLHKGESVTVTVDVKNTGSVAGDAVAQLYIHQRTGSASRPVRQLKGFERLALQPGESRTVKFVLGKDELEYWSPESKSWVVEPGNFDVWAGGDSMAKLKGEFTVAE